MKFEAGNVSLREVFDVLSQSSVNPAIEASCDVFLNGLSIDSRTTASSDLFVCKGSSFSPGYLSMALERGAVAYMCEKTAAEDLSALEPDVPRIVVDDIRTAMALVAPMVYGYPDKDLTVIGITGTKGKSTVAYMLRAIMAAAGAEASILGSIETDDGVECRESRNTTPEAPDLWRHLFNTKQSGRRHMVMEVSSQGLKYDRVLGLNLDIACFLNIGRDHISPVEHSSFEDYFESKLRIFEQCETAVVNLDMDCADQVLEEAQKAKDVVTFGIAQKGGDFYARDIHPMNGGLVFDVVESGIVRHAFLGMSGLFNVSNALAASAIARQMGVSWECILKGLEIVRVPGRMESVCSPDGRIVAIVDYAHNELSFQAVFSSIKKEYPGHAVIAVFGTPGDKVQERRKQLPKVASAYADLVIFTEDEPAHERVEDICEELCGYMPEGSAYEVVCDREQAIRRAVEAARSGPAVLALLGKGHEAAQHRGDEYVPTKSDLQIIKEIFLKG